MKSSLVIDLATLPEEGKTFSGELDGKIFDLPPGDAAPAGPLEYCLYAQRFGSELLLTGALAAKFNFTCGVTLKAFLKTIRLDSAAVSVEIGTTEEIDATPALREEIILEFPASPRCDQGDIPEPCELDSRYLAVDKSSETGISPLPRREGDDRWSALNDLTGLRDQP